METILKATSLHKCFGPIRALFDANLSINLGEVVALIGDNGAGKSTLIKILSGVFRPDSGSLQNSIGLKGVGISAEALVGTLSGGERQGMAISRAMHFNAVLTILDEPTTALAVGEVGRVLNFVRSIADKGNSALFISHNLHHVHEVADRFVFVNRGTIVHQCTRAEMSIAELFDKLEQLSMVPVTAGGQR